jgi:general stress protein 26
LLNIKNTDAPFDEMVGFAEAFRKSRIIFMVTFTESGEEHSRAMTNFNENPYEVMWFPTATSTRKVEDIKKNKKVLLLFPASEMDMYYELEGEGYLSGGEELNERWVWWWLYWHPHQAERYWESREGQHPERTIIKIRPISARLLQGSKAEDMKKSMPKF